MREIVIEVQHGPSVGGESYIKLPLILTAQPSADMALGHVVCIVADLQRSNEALSTRSPGVWHVNQPSPQGLWHLQYSLMGTCHTLIDLAYIKLIHCEANGVLCEASAHAENLCCKLIA